MIEISVKFLTAESVCMGHPDKLCDLIADSVLDACLEKDVNSRVACEVIATKGKIIVAGEITRSGRIDIPKIVRRVLRKVGYDPKAYKVAVFIQKQSPDIASSVSLSLEARNGQKDPYDRLGAGDQGTVYGFATNETKEKLPLPLVLAHRIVKRLDECRGGKLIKGILPDGKSQVTIAYEDGKPAWVESIVVSVQHQESLDYQTLVSEITTKVLLPCFEDFPFGEQTEVLINPSGRFVLGGPGADTGLTGRKLMVDTYGGLASHGGGALSGKDATKVDRSGAYMARYVAKNIVTSGLADRCEVGISYAIGKAEPVAISVNTFGTSSLPDDFLRSIVLELFDLRPAAIIERFKLYYPRFKDTSTYGHFGPGLFPWEDFDMYEALVEASKGL